MKKNLIVVLAFVSSVVYAQEPVCSPVKIQSDFVNSIIMMPNVTKVDVTSATLKEQFNHYQSAVFRVEDNFLVLDGNLYFDLNKVIAFKKKSRVQAKGDLIEFYFQ